MPLLCAPLQATESEDIMDDADIDVMMLDGPGHAAAAAAGGRGRPAGADGQKAGDSIAAAAAAAVQQAAAEVVAAVQAEQQLQAEMYPPRVSGVWSWC